MSANGAMTTAVAWFRIPLGIAIWLAVAWCCAAAEDKSEAATRQYNAAVALQNKGAFELAAEEWESFLGEFRNDARCDRAQHYLGMAMLKLGKLDAAEQAFATALGKYPKSELTDASLLLLGITRYTAAQGGRTELYASAAENFATLLKDHPKSPRAAQARFYRGECFYAQNKKAEAAKQYAELLEKNPDDRLAADALYALGVSQEELGEPAAAAATYDRYLTKYANSPLATEVLMRRGECDLAAGRYDEAIKRLSAAAGKDGFKLADYATIRQALALVQAKRLAEGAALYAAIPARFPKSAYVATAQLAGGRAYYQAGDTAAARKLLAEAIDEPGDAGLEAAHWSARCWLREGKPAEALAAVERAVRNADRSALLPQLLMDQADSLYEVADRRKDSVARYAELAQKFPDDANTPQALYMAAFAALSLGEYEPARKHAVAFLADGKRRESEWAADVRAIVAEASLQLKDYAEAEKRFADLATRYPQHAEVEAWQVRQGLSLHLLKEHRRAIEVLTPLIPGLRTAEHKAEAQFLIGGGQVELQQLDEAEKSLEASLAASAKWRQADDALLLLAHVQNLNKKTAKAAAALKQLIADHPKSRLLDQAHYRLGENALAAEEWKTAVGEYETVLQQWPDGPLAPLAMYGLGWAQFKQGDAASAEKTLGQLIDRFGEHKLVPRGRYARALARQQLGQWAAATEELEALLADEPVKLDKTERTEALYVLALCRVGQKQYREAVESLEQVLAAGPKPGLAEKSYYELGWALKALDSDDKAAAAFAKLHELNPNGELAGECLYHVGEQAYKRGDLKTAAASYAASAQKTKNDDIGEKATHKLGWSHFRGEQFAEAENAFAEQLRRWPKGPLADDGRFMLAESLFKQDKFETAAATYQAVKAPTIKDADVLSLLHGGEALGRTKKWDESLAMLNRLAERFPESPLLPEAWYEQGVAQRALGKPAEALKLWEQVIGKTRREVAARAQFAIGQTQYEQKNYVEATKSFFRVSHGYSYPALQAEATYEAGRCFEALGQRENAIKRYEELLEKYPKSEKSRLAQQAIERLKQYGVQ